MFAGRTTGDVVAIVFALAVALAIIGAGCTIAVLALTDRSDDAADVVGYLESVLTTALGAVLGLIAGRTVRATTTPGAVAPGEATPAQREEPQP